MVLEFLKWWAEQMLSLVPSRFRVTSSLAANGLIMEPLMSGGPGHVTSVRVFRRQGNQERSLGEFPLSGDGAIEALRRKVGSSDRKRGVYLRLDAARILEKQLVLPLAAERDIDRVLRYEMDKLSPFKPEEVFSAFHVEKRDREMGRISVRMRLVPRATVAPIITAMVAAGAGPRAIEVHGKAGTIPLARDAAASAVARRRLSYALISVCTALGIALAVIPFVRQSQAFGKVDRLIETFQPRVTQAEAIRKRLQAEASSVDILSAQRARSGDVLAVLAATTEILPDDTFLSELTLNQRRLGLQGQSAAAARLIAALAADPAMRNPSFTAPVIRNDLQKLDIFSIQAEVRP